MAEAIDPENSLKNAVGCAVCFEYMVDSRTLVPCMHTFCAECVSKISQKMENSILGILCPLCRTFITYDNIKPNPFVNSVIEMIAHYDSGNKADENQTECVQCGSINIAVRCLHCNDNLCKRCENRHNRITGCQNHKIVSLEEAQCLQKKNVVVFCSRHPSREIERNCVPCNQVVCAECLYDVHNTHESESIDKALNKVRVQVKEAIADITVKINDRKSVIMSIKETNDKINDNKSNIIDQIKKHKYKIIKQFSDQVNQEYEDLLCSFDVNLSSESKELELSRHDIENNVVSDESLVTWILTILDKTDGGGLLRELQSGLLTRIKQIQEQSSSPDDVKPSPTKLKLYEFVPIYPKHSRPLLGEIQVVEESDVRLKTSADNLQPKESDTGIKQFTSKSNQTAVKSHSTEGFNTDRLNKVASSDNEPSVISERNSVDSYRFSEIKLDNLTSKDVQDGVSLGKLASRLCVFWNQLWVPCYTDASISVISRNLYVRKTIKLASVSQPHSLHPINLDQLALVAESGLYILDCDGHVQRQVETTKFDDVHVDKHLLAGVTSDMVYIWDVSTSEEWKRMAQFDVESSNYSKTVHIRDPHIYLSGFNNRTLHKYSMTGELLVQFTGHIFNFLHLCMSDDEHNLLVCHDGNKLTVVSENGSVVTSSQVSSDGIADVVILDNTLYVLDAWGNIYKI